MKNSVKLIFVSALMLTAAACSKDAVIQVPGKTPVRFDIGVEGTKATLINNEGAGFESFKTSGFSVIAYEGSTKKMDKVAVTNPSGSWTYTGDYLWKKNTTMRFFGYYPKELATTLDGKTTNSGIASFTYSPLASGVTADVNDQTDYMLATYNGTGTDEHGNNGVAALNFSHPLASIQFKCGSFDTSVTAIKGIAIGGFYTSATCAPTAGNAGFTYEWGGQDGTAVDGALSQTGFTLTPSANTVIGTPFLLIPEQNFSSKNLTVLLTVTIGGVDKTLLATINSGTLVQGQTTTCTINYGKGLSFSCELTEWVESESDKKDIEVEEAKKELHITSLADLNAFKAEIESATGKDYSGYTIFLDENIEFSTAYDFVSIYDKNKHLNGVTFDGQNHEIKLTGDVQVRFLPNDSDSNGTSGLFSTLKSDNVTFANIDIESIKSCGTGASFIVGTYEGSQITIDNCQFEYCQSQNTSKSTVGMIIGICKGNATINNCTIMNSQIMCSGSYTSFVIGEAAGGNNIDIENVSISDSDLLSTSAGYAFGMYVGKCTNYSGMNILIKNCSSNLCKYNSQWSLNPEYYKHTGSGMVDGILTDNSHFYAVAWNNSGEGTGLTVSMSEMSLSNLTNIGY